jgi:hypothetical protein
MRQFPADTATVSTSVPRSIAQILLGVGDDATKLQQVMEPVHNKIKAKQKLQIEILKQTRYAA